MQPCYARITGMSQDRRALDATAYATLLVLTALWGFQQVAIKAVAADVTLLMQAAIRSVLATLLLLAWMRWRGQPLLQRDGTLWAGIVAGVLFALEFVFIYGGLAHTNASRMSVFIYLAPAVTALGLHLFVPGERLAARQWGGVALAFAGIVVAFSEGFLTSLETWRGDLCGIAAALLWGATTVIVRSTALSRASAAKTLLYQIAASALILPVASLLMGEKGVVALTPAALASLAFQGVVVAFASYLAWFWLLTRYLASRVAVFSCLTPMFGVLSGVVFLGEPLSASFAAAALLVAAGIVLVNLRR
jgi:drug/metabolite transporter (DMT)-like permease